MNSLSLVSKVYFTLLSIQQAEKRFTAIGTRYEGHVYNLKPKAYGLLINGRKKGTKTIVGWNVFSKGIRVLWVKFLLLCSAFPKGKKSFLWYAPDMKSMYIEAYLKPKAYRLLINSKKKRNQYHHLGCFQVYKNSFRWCLKNLQHWLSNKDPQVTLQGSKRQKLYIHLFLQEPLLLLHKP